MTAIPDFIGETQELFLFSSEIFRCGMFTSRRRSCGKIMFSQVPPCDHYLWCIVTYPHYHTWDIPLSPLDTCSNLFTWGPIPHRYWHLAMTTKGGQCASYWFAVFFWPIFSPIRLGWWFLLKKSYQPWSWLVIHCTFSRNYLFFAINWSHYSSRLRTTSKYFSFSGTWKGKNSID